MRRDTRPAAPPATKRPVHTAEQMLQEMERQFPEFVADERTTADELRFRAGQRSVVRAMRDRLEATQKRDPF